MNAGIKKRLEAAVQRILRYLEEHGQEMSEEEITEALDKINEYKDILESFAD